MLDELQRRTDAPGTVGLDIQAIDDFGRHFGHSPNQLGPAHIRHHQTQLIRDRIGTDRFLPT